MAGDQAEIFLTERERIPGMITVDTTDIWADENYVYMVMDANGGESVIVSRAYVKDLIKALETVIAQSGRQEDAA